MEEILTSANVGWAGVVALVLSVVSAIVYGRRAAKAKREAEVDKARVAFLETLKTGNQEQIIIAHRKWRNLARGLSVAALALFLSGCRTRLEYVPIGNYCLFPVEGETVPKLPANETRWMLLSVPTGADLILGAEGLE